MKAESSYNDALFCLISASALHVTVSGFKFQEDNFIEKYQLSSGYKWGNRLCFVALKHCITLYCLRDS